MKCYEGSEPYIFLSYAHKNTDMVMPVFEGLYREGFRIWYDAGTEPGTEWPEYIAEHLAGASCCICFLTKEFLDSYNCRQEVNFALSKGIPVLSVYMEDVKLTAGMEMRLGLAQAMFRNRYAMQTEFEKALFEAKLLTPCRNTLQNEISPELPVRYSKGLTFAKLKDGTYAVTGMGACKDTELVIPPTTPEGGKVTSIGDKAFSWCSGLTSIKIPTGVTSIGYAAFCGCSDLTSITIPDSVKSIGNRAFSDECSDLTSITIPNSVKSIGKCAFAGCSGLTSISVHPNNPVYYSRDNCVIERETSRLVVGIQTSRIPTGVKSIGDSAFSECSGLTSITIPTGVTSIGEYAFNRCSGLTSISVHPNNPVYYSRDNCVIERETSRLVVGIQTSRIPTGVKSIGDWAFSECSGLTSITIPTGVTSIGRYAFNRCSGLTSITIPTGVTSIGEYAFNRCSGLTSITIPTGVTSIGKDAFFWCPNATIYCEHPSQPSTWDKDWNPDNCPVVWNFNSKIQ